MDIQHYHLSGIRDAAATLRDEAEHWRDQNSDKANALSGWTARYAARAAEMERCLGAGAT